MDAEEPSAFLKPVMQKETMRRASPSFPHAGAGLELPFTAAFYVFSIGQKLGSIIDGLVLKSGCFWSLLKHNEKRLVAFLITSLSRNSLKKLY